jgi:hypothetical protein
MRQFNGEPALEQTPRSSQPARDSGAEARPARRERARLTASRRGPAMIAADVPERLAIHRGPPRHLGRHDQAVAAHPHTRGE